MNEVGAPGVINGVTKGARKTRGLDRRKDRAGGLETWVQVVSGLWELRPQEPSPGACCDPSLTARSQVVMAQLMSRLGLVLLGKGP